MKLYTDYYCKSLKKIDNKIKNKIDSLYYKEKLYKIYITLYKIFVIYLEKEQYNIINVNKIDLKISFSKFLTFCYNYYHSMIDRKTKIDYKNMWIILEKVYVDSMKYIFNIIFDDMKTVKNNKIYEYYNRPYLCYNKFHKLYNKEYKNLSINKYEIILNYYFIISYILIDPLVPRNDDDYKNNNILDDDKISLLFNKYEKFIFEYIINMHSKISRENLNTNNYLNYIDNKEYINNLYNALFF